MKQNRHPGTKIHLPPALGSIELNIHKYPGPSPWEMTRSFIAVLPFGEDIRILNMTNPQSARIPPRNFGSNSLPHKHGQPNQSPPQRYLLLP